uniref:TSUP family transporter n=1 Tax=uncultured Haemophilus sp. TaxID=237779 RepID=UPI0027DE26D8
MELGIDILAMLFAAAFIAAFIDAIAGGGGLITIPALLMTGMPPAMAFGTNKLQGFGGTLSASIYFLRKKAINLAQFLFILLMIFIGAIIGSVLIQNIDASLIKKGLPFLILAIGLYFLFTPRLGEKDYKQRISYSVFALCFGTLLGFYDGFFGPGAGSLMNLA